MRDLDETDREILRLLFEDARRPYSDIADAVDLSAPAVSDRVDRLREAELIRRFTLDVDRERLTGGRRVLVQFDAEPGRGADLVRTLSAAEPVEHVFRSADETVVCVATTTDPDAVGDWVDLADVRGYEVRPVAEETWSPRPSGTDLALSCVACGNTVTAEGESATVDGETYHFCCENCQETYLDRYERLREDTPS